LVLALAVVYLAACNGADEQPTIRAISLNETDVPTPTLFPGLPTSSLRSPNMAQTPEPDGILVTPTSTPTVEQTPTPSVIWTPTATPQIAKRIELGIDHLRNENYVGALAEFQAVLLSDPSGRRQQQDALFGLGKAALASGQYMVAADAFSQLIAGGTEQDDSIESELESESVPLDQLVYDAYFLLAQVYVNRGQCRAAVRAYESYLSGNPDMEAYVQPRIAECHLALNDHTAAVSAYEKAASADAHTEFNLELREQLAQLYMDQGQYQDAVEQYDLILQATEDPRLQGRALYKAGWAEILIGDTESGYLRYQQAVEGYPQAFESYLALVDLIESGYEIDDYIRGLVDFEAEAYAPAMAAFNRYVENNPSQPKEAHLYMAWSLEKQGDIASALDELDAHINSFTPLEAVDEEEINPDDLAAVSRGWLEKAKMLARSDDLEGAVDSYKTYIAQFPDGERAPFAAWWAAALTEQLGEFNEAIDLYSALADEYPNHQDAAEALYRAGLISWQEELTDEAISYWSNAAVFYADKEFGAASLVWLLKVSNSDDSEIFEDRAAEISGDSFYHIRAQHIVSGTEPYEAPEEIELSSDLIEQLETELWLREIAGLESGTEIAAISDALAIDGRLVRGEKLWNLGLYAEAKRELENLRLANTEDPVASYQLALYLRDIGLFRSSILAASSILKIAETDIFHVPRFLGTLIYPTYYSDLIVAEAEKYGYDPLLQFALVRQESLFESFATSFAAARGLSQVIPDTGDYIAHQLDWPDYQLEDLYKPYVGIAFGAFYLNQQLETFDGDVAVALSAYNGGPGNAARWSDTGYEEVEEFLEIVDFGETREYIKRIYAGQSIYSYLYSK
jgi:soluble lytic murein transglycosylase